MNLKLISLSILLVLPAYSAENSKCIDIYKNKNLITKKPYERSSTTRIKNGAGQFHKFQKIDASLFISPHEGGFQIKKTVFGDKTFVKLKADENGKLLLSTTESKKNSLVVPSHEIYQLQNQVSQSEALKIYILDNKSPGFSYSDSTVQVLIDMMKKDPEDVQKAYKHLALKNKNGGSVSSASNDFKITNYGEDSFIWFEPEGSSELVPARVQDIHPIYTSPSMNNYFSGEKSKIEGYSFLVEYLKNESGERIRVMAEITPEEFKSVTRNDEFSSAKAWDEFIQELTPIEKEAIDFAFKHDLKLYTYSNHFRSSAESSLNHMSAISEMKNISHLAVSASIQDYIKSYDYLLKDGETSMTNVFDVFARLDPGYVIDNFHHTGFDYMWVIDENGALKVSPKMPKGNNLYAQILRLAAGRKVYAGGDFNINPDGSLDVTYSSNAYQNIDVEWGANENAFGASGDKLNDFVAYIFARQANKRVNRIDYSDARMYMSYNKSGSGFEHAYQSKPNYAEGTTAPRVTKEISWSIDKNEIPLDFAKWQKESGGYNEIDWAYYVLQVNAKMTFRQIKKAYRKLSMHFHPDKSKLENAKENQQIISGAYEVIEKMMKKN